MKRYFAAIAALAAFVLASSGAAPGARQAAGCCVEANLSASWNATTHQATYSFTSPSGFEASNVIFGSTRDGAGKVVMEAWASVPATDGHWGSVGGTYTTYVSPRPTKDFYVQIDFVCRMVPYTSCPSFVDATRHAFSNPTLVSIGATGGGAKAGESETVAFSKTATIRHADGTTETKKEAVLVDRDLVESYGSPVKITLKDGKVAIDRGSRLRYTPKEKQHWRVERGTAWFLRGKGWLAARGTFAGIAGDPGSSFTVSTNGRMDTFRALTGIPDVWPIGESSRHHYLHPGQQITATAGRHFSPVTRFKTTTRPFWK